MDHFLNLVIAVFAAGSQAAVDPWPRFQEGASANYRTRMTAIHEFNDGKERRANRMEMHSEDSWTIRSVEKDGSALVRIVFGPRKGRLQGPLYGEVAFDSESDDVENPLAREFVKDAGKSYELRIDRRGGILEFRPILEGDARGDRNEHREKTLQATLPQVPEGALAVGEKWEPKVPIHECLPSGCVSLPTQCELKGANEREVRIETNASGKNGGAEDAPVTVKLTMAISRADGLPLSLSGSAFATWGAKGAGMTQKLEIDVERVP